MTSEGEGCNMEYLVHNHQNLKKTVRGKNLDVCEVYFGMAVRGI